MELSTIGSINQYAKSVALKTQWNLKKQSGNITGHSKGLSDFVSISGSAHHQEQDNDSEKLGAITAKVNAGAKLTEEEMDYLKEKNPQLYEKLRQIEKEQKAYEEALRHCKSKDEAQRLHMARVGEAMQAVKNGDGTAAYRMNRMTESTSTFIETDEYKKLSTEAEQALERKEQYEMEQAGPEPAVSEGKAEKDETVERSEKARESSPPDGEKKSESGIHTEKGAQTAKPVDQNVPRAEESNPPVKSAPRFGTRAYVSQQESEETRRHKTIDREA